MKIVSVVGARPNFVKMSPLVAAIDDHNNRMAAHIVGRGNPALDTIQHVLVHTGQHYSHLMSGSFFSDLELPTPDVYLGVGSGSHAVLTGEIMSKFEDVLSREKPDIVVVVGDVNSTLACALATAKPLSGSTRPLIAHVEAGLRSFDRSMPEEINRVLTDHVADLLFVTEESGLRNLQREGIAPERVHFVGNTMIDSLIAFQEKAETSKILEQLGLRSGTNGTGQPVQRYAILTLHRPSNVDERDGLLNILAGLKELATACRIIFPVHPRTRNRLVELRLESDLSANGIVLTDPLGYLDFVCLMKHASLVVTDSGGVQEETTWLGVPCVTVRDTTERPVTVEWGTNIVAGTSPERIEAAIRQQMGRSFSHGAPPNWDGHAAARIVDVLIRAYHGRAR
jgi:UDP-N-acetylglucosamine 2-epimerase (non-hydrolysing)